MHFCGTHSALQEVLQDPDGQKSQMSIPGVPVPSPSEVSKAYLQPQ